MTFFYYNQVKPGNKDNVYVIQNLLVYNKINRYTVFGSGSGWVVTVMEPLSPAPARVCRCRRSVLLM